MDGRKGVLLTDLMSDSEFVAAMRKTRSVQCRTCEEWKDREAFRKSGAKRGHDLDCKACQARALRLHTRTMAGMSLEAVLAEPGPDDRCEICGSDGGGKTLCVDHDHTSGDFRGFLCNGCNSGLGFFKDDPERMRQAAAYIEAHPTSIPPEPKNSL